MATKKSILVLFGILVISAWVLWSANQAGAETMNYKFYAHEIKTETVPVGDVEGHTVGLHVRKAFFVFENGEIATATYVITSEMIKGSGSFNQYLTITFADGSTIISKEQGPIGGVAGAVATSRVTAEIIKGTGRFEGIKGTRSGSGKFYPIEKGEAGPRGSGEGTITYTLPKK
jgi:hypothetical protein